MGRTKSTVTSGVYRIMNTVTGKIYIGSSKNIEHRFIEHKTHLNEGWHHSEELQRDWDKYGEKNFSFDILVVTDEANARKIEQEYITKFNTVKFGYNSASGTFAKNGNKRWERFKANLWKVIKDTYSSNNNLYLYDLFSVCSEMKLSPTKFLHTFGIDKEHRMDVGIIIKDDEGNDLYVGLNWDNSGIYLAICDANKYNEKECEFIYV